MSWAALSALFNPENPLCFFQVFLIQGRLPLAARLQKLLHGREIADSGFQALQCTKAQLRVQLKTSPITDTSQGPQDPPRQGPPRPLHQHEQETGHRPPVRQEDDSPIAFPPEMSSCETPFNFLNFLLISPAGSPSSAVWGKEMCQIARQENENIGKWGWK